MVEVRMLCLTSNSEIVQNLLEQTWNLLAKKHVACARTGMKSKGLLFKHVKFSPDFTTGQLKRQLSHLGRGASLRIVIENELNSVKKDLHQKTKRTHRRHDQKARVDGRKGSSRQRFGRLCHNDAVARCTSSTFNGFIMITLR